MCQVDVVIKRIRATLAGGTLAGQGRTIRGDRLSTATLKIFEQGRVLTLLQSLMCRAGVIAIFCVEELHHLWVCAG